LAVNRYWPKFVLRFEYLFMNIGRKFIWALAIVFSLNACGGGDDFEEFYGCQECIIIYSYELTEIDDSGTPITTNEEGEVTTGETCGASSQLLRFEEIVRQEALDFERELRRNGAQNIQTSVICERKS